MNTFVDKVPGLLSPENSELIECHVWRMYERMMVDH